MDEKSSYLTMTELIGFIGALLAIALGLLKAEADRRRDRVKLNSEIASIKATAAAQQEALEQKAIAQIMAQQKDFAEQNAKLSNRINQLSEALQKSLTRRAAMESNLKAQIANLGAQIAEKDKQIKTISDKAETREAALVERVAALEKRVEEMAESIAVKDNTIKALEGENQQLKIVIERHKAREGRWATDREKMTEQIKGLEQERDTLKARLDAQETRIEKLETSTGSIPIVKEEEDKDNNENPGD